jgi:fructose-bisphosphate aldolase class II
MLVTLNEIMGIAEAKGWAIGAFNTPNLECLTAVLDAAEDLNLPVIISHAEVHEPVAPIRIIGPIMVEAAKKATVPVCVHLDHCETLGYMEQALEMGFTGAMYDGSSLSYEENVKNTRIAVSLAKKYGADVEAEIGQLASREDGTVGNGGGPVYTDPELAAKFCAETGIDALAPSFGTAHGIYKSKPILDFDRVKTIAEKTGLPLVMHGGSGVSDDDYRSAIRNGIRKINYYSYMAKAGVNAVKLMLCDDVTYYHDLALAAQKAMQADAQKAMRIFAMNQFPEA